MDIIRAKASLSPHELSILTSEFEKHKKSTGLAYVLWFFLGTLGVHRIYIGKAWSGIGYLILGALAWNFLIAHIAGPSGAVRLAVWLGDLHPSLLRPAAIVIDLYPAFIGSAVILWIIIGIWWIVDLFTIPRQIRKIYERTESRIIEAIIRNRSQVG